MSRIGGRTKGRANDDQEDYATEHREVRLFLAGQHAGEKTEEHGRGGQERPTILGIQGDDRHRTDTSLPEGTQE